MGRDYTLFALVDGTVKYTRKRGDRRFISVTPKAAAPPGPSTSRSPRPRDSTQPN